MTLFVVTEREPRSRHRPVLRSLWWVREEALAEARRLATAFMEDETHGHTYRVIGGPNDFRVQVKLGSDEYRDHAIFAAQAIEPQGTAIGRLAALA